MTFGNKTVSFCHIVNYCVCHRARQMHARRNGVRTKTQRGGVNEMHRQPRRALSPAFAAVSATLMSLGGGDPDQVATALHGGTCWECLTGGGDCDGRPSDDDRAFAHAFASTLEVFSELAAPSFRAFDGNQS